MAVKWLKITKAVLRQDADSSQWYARVVLVSRVRSFNETFFEQNHFNVWLKPSLPSQNFGCMPGKASNIINTTKKL